MEDKINDTQTQQTANDSAPQNNGQPTIEETLAAQRQMWVDEITKLNDGMKTLPKVDELLNTVYSKRQSLVDYFYSMSNVIAKQNKEYKSLYNTMFNNIKVNGYQGIRFSSDQQIARQIETDLQDRKEIIDLLNNQNSFIKDTIQTVDNIIYGINTKVKIHAMLNGINSI